MHAIFALRNCGLAGIVLIAAALAGGAVRDAQADPGVQSRAEPAAVATAVAASSKSVPITAQFHAVQSRSGEWVFLGEKRASLQTERDRIVIGRQEGKFRELRFTVKGAPVEIYEMVVTFGNGTQFKPQNVKWLFDERSTSHRIELPGDLRAIQHVDFVYRSPSRGQGHAIVSLYGR